MNRRQTFSSVVMAAVLLAGPLPAFSQDAAPAADSSAAAPAFSEEQLEELVAPVALYPDALLAQVLMAATYPLEIVEAARWLKKNTGLQGEDLDKALKDQAWDPSIKGLCAVPDVVQRMNDNLDWTQDLGDAFLAQQDDVMYAVQVLRSKAYEAGNLKTTEQQKVEVKQQKDTQVIVIEQASPTVVYVPTYSSAVVYGPTYVVAQPTYPAVYSPPGYGLLAFGAGMAVGAAIWGDCHWGYGCCGGYGRGNYYGGNNNVNINVNNYNNFNNRVNNNWNNNLRAGNNNWNHQPQHRKGVNYRNPQTAQRFGASKGSSRVTQNQARGFSNRATTGRSGALGSGTAGRGGSGTAGRTGSLGSGSRGTSASRSAARPTSPSRPSSVSRPSSTSRPSAATRPSPSRGSSVSRPTSRPSHSSGFGGGAFHRSGSSSRDRAASARGASSRGGGGFSRGSSRGGFSGGSRGGSRGGRRR